MKRHYPVVAAFLIPAMALLVIFKIYPILLGIYDSLFSYSFVNKATLFAGLDNYITVLKDASFQNSLKVTLFFNVIVNPIQVVLSFGLALLLMVKLKGQRVFRTVHIIPITVSFTIACTLWGVFLSPEQGLMTHSELVRHFKSGLSEQQQAGPGLGHGHCHLERVGLLGSVLYHWAGRDPFTAIRGRLYRRRRLLENAALRHSAANEADF